MAGASGDHSHTFNSPAALEALAICGCVWVVATLRSDFFDRVETLPRLARLSANEGRYLLTPPDSGEIAQLIRQPAREAGLRFEVDPASGQSLDEVMDGRRKTIPAQRFGNAEEFGAACAFLCSQQASYIVGQNLLTDGGAYPGTF